MSSPSGVFTTILEQYHSSSLRRLASFVTLTTSTFPTGASVLMVKVRACNEGKDNKVSPGHISKPYVKLSNTYFNYSKAVMLNTMCNLLSRV